MTDFIFFLGQLAVLASGILLFLRYKNSNVGIFGGIGFAALFLIPLLQRTLFEVGIPWYRAGILFNLFTLAAYCFILYALYIMPSAGGAAAFKFQDIIKPPAPDGSQPAAQQSHPAQAYIPGMLRPLSKPFYLGSILASSTVSLILFAFAMFLVFDNDEEEAVVLWMFGFFVAAYGIIVFGVFIHTMWKVIQDGRVRTTPGKAVGFLFIPFYNFYWIFQSLLGWAQDFNSYIKEKNINTIEMPEGFVKTLCIIGVLQAIPYIGWPISLFYMMLMGIFIDRVGDAVNAVVGYKLAAQTQSDMT